MPYNPYLTDVNTGAEDGDIAAEDARAKQNPLNKWDEGRPKLPPQHAPVRKIVVKKEQLFADQALRLQDVSKNRWNRNSLLLAYAAATKKDHEDI